MQDKTISRATRKDLFQVCCSVYLHETSNTRSYPQKSAEVIGNTFNHTTVLILLLHLHITYVFPTMPNMNEILIFVPN